MYVWIYRDIFQYDVYICCVYEMYIIEQRDDVLVMIYNINKKCQNKEIK